VSSVAPIHRSLEQELQALLRGVSLECLVCGEFVLHAGGMINCPECGSSLRAKVGVASELTGRYKRNQQGTI
jgi:Zn finger protein HypA/HybF involved in hydrogenase expression